jgi:hypothetical protein
VASAGWSSGAPAARAGSATSSTASAGTAPAWTASTAPASGAATACSPTTWSSSPGCSTPSTTRPHEHPRHQAKRSRPPQPRPIALTAKRSSGPSRLAPAAPPQRLEQPSRLQTLDHSSALDRRVGRHLYIIRTAGSSQAGRERGHARSRQGALTIVETLHDARGCGYRRGWSIEGRTGPGALNLYKMSCGGGCSRAGRPRG